MLTNKVPLRSIDSKDECQPNGIAAVMLDDEGLLGQWSILEGSGTIHNLTHYYTSITQLSLGRNVFRYIATKGECSNYSDCVINYYSPPQAYIEPTNTVLCRHYHNLTTNPPDDGDGLWSVTKGGAQIETPQSETTNLDNLSSGDNIIRWTIIQGDCTTIDEITIRYNPVSVSLVESQNCLCRGSGSGTATYQISDGTAPYTIEGFEITTPDNNQIKVADLEPDNYNFRVVDNKMCTSTNVNLVIEGPDEVLRLSVDDYKDETSSGTKDGFVKVVASGGTPPYKYYFEGSIYSSSYFTGLVSGEYEIIVEDKNKCTSTIVINLVDGTTGLDSETLLANTLNIYPNPARDLVTFSGTNHSNSTIEISVYTISGQRILQKEIKQADKYEYKWEIQNYPAGIYIVRVQGNDSAIIRKLIIK